jgi:exonuclease SbcD
MSVPIRFIHSSDFHLDRPPRGLAEVPDHLRAALVDAPYRAAERVFDAALKERVDFVLLVGDLADLTMAGPQGPVFLGEQFRRLTEQGIGVYWALGRSDGRGRWPDGWQLPEGVVRFAENRVERAVFRRDGEPIAQIFGTSAAARQRIRLSQFLADSSELFAIAVAHGSADADLLARHAIRYWALGGEHQRRAVLSGPTMAHYCGSPQGRRPRESGPHGCTLVHVDEERRVRSSFIPTDAVRFLDERVAVNESATPDQLQQILDERVAELAGDPFGPELLVRWTIEGSKALALELRRGRLAADALARLRADHALRRPAVWSVSIEAEPAAGVSDEQFEEQTLLGEFLRTVKHYAEHPDEPLSLEPYLPTRHVAESLGSAVELDDPAQRERVLGQVARLGVELLSVQEPRP